jgi:hypothetical protein
MARRGAVRGADHRQRDGDGFRAETFFPARFTLTEIYEFPDRSHFIGVEPAGTSERIDQRTLAWKERA